MTSIGGYAGAAELPFANAHVPAACQRVVVGQAYTMLLAALHALQTHQSMCQGVSPTSRALSG